MAGTMPAAELSTAAEPEPMPSRAPTSSRTRIAEAVIKDEDGLTLESRKWNGAIKLVRCANVRIVDCEAFGAAYSGLWLEDCPGAQVIGGENHHNGGHGIHLGGDCGGVVVDGAILRDNLEDGVQMANSAGNRAVFHDCWFIRNSENGFDGKNGKATFVDCMFKLNGTGLGTGGGREQVIVHQGDRDAASYFEDLVMIRCSLLTPAYVSRSSCIRVDGPRCTARLVACLLDARHGNNQCIRSTDGAEYTAVGSRFLGDLDNPDKELVRSTEGATGVIDACKLVKTVSDRKWFQVEGRYYDRAFELSVDHLTVRNCT